MPDPIEEDLNTLTHVYDYTTDIILILRVVEDKFIVMSLNKTFQKLAREQDFARNPEELVGITVTELFRRLNVDENEINARIKNYQTAMETRQTRKYDSKTPLPQGGYLYHESHVTPVCKDGKCTHILIIARDTTESKKSESQFRDLAANSPNMIFIKGKDKILYVNNLCETMMGYSREEFYSSDFDFLSLIAPDYRHLVTDNYRKHLSGQEVRPYEYKLVTKEGKELYAIISTKLIHFHGEPALLGIITDITEKKNMEKRLRESQDFINNIMNSTSEIIFAVDESGQVRAWNATAEFITKYKAKDIVGKNLFELDFFKKSDLPEILEEEQVVDRVFETEIRTANSRAKILRLSVSIIESEDQVIGYVFIGNEKTTEADSIKLGHSYLTFDPEMPQVKKFLKGGGIYISRNIDPEDYDCKIINLDQSVKSTENLLNTIKNYNSRIYLSRVDYIISKVGFDKFLHFLYDLNDHVRNNSATLMVLANPETLSSNELALLKAELQLLPKNLETDELEPELIEILELISNNQLKSMLTSFKEIKNAFKISSVTTRKRITQLVNRGYINVNKKGRKKTLALTDKGYNILQPLQ